MALNINTAPANNNVRNVGDESWKAQGFLNLYLPSRGGQRRKLGSIPLKESRSSEKELLAWLNEDPTRVGKLLGKLEMEFQPAVKADENHFDLDS